MAEFPHRVYHYGMTMLPARKFGFRNFAMANPMRILVLGYLIIALAGAILLSLPVSFSEPGKHSFIDALFMASSGISTTGLATIDVGGKYSLFGQLVLFSIFQIGGTGYMAFLILIPYLAAGKNSLTMQNLARESIAVPDHKHLGTFFRSVIGFTMLVEFAGTILLAIRWVPDFGWGRGLYAAAFHSVSAFCTAGFTIFPDSMIRYRFDPLVNVTINGLSLLGGTGFVVIYSIKYWFTGLVSGKKRFRLDTHSRIVLLTTLLLVLTATLLIFIAEFRNGRETPAKTIVLSLFQVISATTTDGFNSVDIGAMSPVSLVVFLVLMFVGAAPGSTGGGIKNTTFALILVFLWHQLKGRENAIVVMRREIPDNSFFKAVGIFIWFILIIMINMMIMGLTEKLNFLPLLFETVSALGNTGLSMGTTSSLSIMGKILLMVTMFIGRVGPLTFGLALTSRSERAIFRYPQGDIHVG
jgi:trk system potassium uptake protein TrkH